ncbi:MAG TPA: PIN domain-containing protein [Verrucomicrobiae bacterium]|nr:PIN domain-containing protein [Verrucomicrobiae bacterium]
MSVRRFWVDTNVLLHFLTGEPAPQAEAARELFRQAAEGQAVLDISPVIVAEAYYTLHSFYRFEREQAAEKLLLLLQQRGVKLGDASQVTGALERLRTINTGFADAFLAAGAAKDNTPIASFDRDFGKFKDVIRFEPGRSKY